ncbi:hypothetical protein PR202_gb09342 [Eleusine coracana subsp. coracana]|uniref:Uncharacterized protein n=1 Tax=Eleusine coracana subsp. coracana TaxID=191504 RepID=A0AAV5EI07_ELECO|nr:hypothetical protein PR202_gb09342 [Eleusine coracana subsp. coracana]
MAPSPVGSPQLRPSPCTTRATPLLPPAPPAPSAVSPPSPRPGAPSPAPASSSASAPRTRTATRPSVSHAPLRAWSSASSGARVTQRQGRRLSPESGLPTTSKVTTHPCA